LRALTFRDFGNAASSADSALAYRSASVRRGGFVMLNQRAV
jgi:hypothetical protein